MAADNNDNEIWAKIKGAFEEFTRKFDEVKDAIERKAINVDINFDASEIKTELKEVTDSVKDVAKKIQDSQTDLKEYMKNAAEESKKAQEEMTRLANAARYSREEFKKGSAQLDHYLEKAGYHVRRIESDFDSLFGQMADAPDLVNIFKLPEAKKQLAEFGKESKNQEEFYKKIGEYTNKILLDQRKIKADALAANDTDTAKKAQEMIDAAEAAKRGADDIRSGFGDAENAGKILFDRIKSAQSEIMDGSRGIPLIAKAVNAARGILTEVHGTDFNIDKILRVPEIAKAIPDIIERAKNSSDSVAEVWKDIIKMLEESGRVPEANIAKKLSGASPDSTPEHRDAGKRLVNGIIANLPGNEIKNKFMESLDMWRNAMSQASRPFSAMNKATSDFVTDLRKVQREINLMGKASEETVNALKKSAQSIVMQGAAIALNNADISRQSRRSIGELQSAVGLYAANIADQVATNGDVTEAVKFLGTNARMSGETQRDVRKEFMESANAVGMLHSQFLAFGKRLQAGGFLDETGKMVSEASGPLMRDLVMLGRVAGLTAEQTADFASKLSQIQPTGLNAQKAFAGLRAGATMANVEVNAFASQIMDLADNMQGFGGNVEDQIEAYAEATNRLRLFGYTAKGAEEYLKRMQAVAMGQTPEQSAAILSVLREIDPAEYEKIVENTAKMFGMNKQDVGMLNITDYLQMVPQTNPQESLDIQAKMLDAVTKKFGGAGGITFGKSQIAGLFGADPQQLMQKYAESKGLVTPKKEVPPTDQFQQGFEGLKEHFEKMNQAITENGAKQAEASQGLKDLMTTEEVWKNFGEAAANALSDDLVNLADSIRNTQIEAANMIVDALGPVLGSAIPGILGNVGSMIGGAVTAAIGTAIGSAIGTAGIGAALGSIAAALPAVIAATAVIGGIAAIGSYGKDAYDAGVEEEESEKKNLDADEKMEPVLEQYRKQNEEMIKSLSAEQRESYAKGMDEAKKKIDLENRLAQGGWIARKASLEMLREEVQLLMRIKNVVKSPVQSNITPLPAPAVVAPPPEIKTPEPETDEKMKKTQEEAAAQMKKAEDKAVKVPVEPKQVAEEKMAEMKQQALPDCSCDLSSPDLTEAAKTMLSASKTMENAANQLKNIADQTIGVGKLPQPSDSSKEMKSLISEMSHAEKENEDGSTRLAAVDQENAFKEMAKKDPSKALSLVAEAQTKLADKVENTNNDIGKKVAEKLDSVVQKNSGQAEKSAKAVADNAAKQASVLKESENRQKAQIGKEQELRNRIIKYFDTHGRAKTERKFGIEIEQTGEDEEGNRIFNYRDKSLQEMTPLEQQFADAHRKAPTIDEEREKVRQDIFNKHLSDKRMQGVDVQGVIDEGEDKQEYYGTISDDVMRDYMKQQGFQEDKIRKIMGETATKQPPTNPVQMTPLAATGTLMMGAGANFVKQKTPLDQKENDMAELMSKANRTNSDAASTLKSLLDQRKAQPLPPISPSPLVPSSQDATPGSQVSPEAVPQKSFDMAKAAASEATGKQQSMTLNVSPSLKLETTGQENDVIRKIMPIIEDALRGIIRDAQNKNNSTDRTSNN